MTIDGVTFWGSPWQPEFCDWAFNLPCGEPLAAKWRLIPTGTDVVITHGPVYGHGDYTSMGMRCGCKDLLHELQERVRPQYQVCGHIHEGYGVSTDGKGTAYLNASTCTHGYNPTNPPLVFDVAGRAGPN